MAEEIRTDETQEGTEHREAPAAEEKPLDKMTAVELREIAKAIPGVTGASAMKKGDLLKVIKEHRGIRDEVPGQKPVMDIKTVKAKVAQLKLEKRAAQESKDRKKINILRCRINRLKKRARRAAAK